MTAVTLLGSTGSIGHSALDVIRANAERFRVYALAAGQNVESLARQIVEFKPQVAVLSAPGLLPVLTEALLSLGLPRKDWPELAAGPQALIAISTAAEAPIVISAIVGVGGLEATYAAACAGKRIGLANKECLVSAGKLIMEAVRRHAAELLPVDSEHNGAHQCFRAGRLSEVRRLILTASGGPFRETPHHRFAEITPEQALRHPTWKMGSRITIDSATLMNKGFEVIEACWLFDLPSAQVDVVIHPQSTVHAMVEFLDGSILAQACATDMRMPIQYALTWPERWDAPVPLLDWTVPRHWDFSPPDLQRFPLLGLAYQAQQLGGSAACTLNAADEVAVSSFLDREITFPEIFTVVSKTLERMPVRHPTSIDAILEMDAESRRIARQVIGQRETTMVSSIPIKVHQ